MKDESGFDSRQRQEFFFTASKQLFGLPHPMDIEGFITGDSVTEE